jgi:predicted nucleic-acid-binding Zn-ribbon protein
MSDAHNMVGGVCPHCQNTSYYILREICREGQDVYRLIRPPSQRQVVVKCQHCDKRFKILVDCEEEA